MIASREFDIVCDADITYSVTENPYAGTGNEDIGVLTSGNQDVWFAGAGTGELHLNAPPAAVLTTAQWQTGDPAMTSTATHGPWLTARRRRWSRHPVSPVIDIVTSA